MVTGSRGVRRAALAGLASALLLLGLTGMPAEGGGAAAAARPSLGATTKLVTLITGDTVHYTRSRDGRETVVVDPAPRESGVAPYFTMSGGETGYYVIPSDVRPRLRAGVLDRELFDVRDLVAAGLGDRSARRLPVIATYAGKPTARTLSREVRELPGSRPVRSLPGLASVAMKLERGKAERFWEVVAGADVATSRLGGGLRKLWLDAPVRALLDESVPQVGAPAAWDLGYDGSGVKVAVLDTGVDATHPDLEGQVVGSENFTTEPSATDGNGHGTHVASTVAGTGAASDGSRKGVAPGASILSGKVLDDSGSGFTSWAVAGMEWAAESGARVVNMSLSSGPTDGSDFMSQAVNAYTASHGVLFVAAAGNNGPGASTVASPSVADAALSVASVDKQDVISSFSSRGPRREDGAVKPEIAAPGAGIVAARAAGTSLGDPQGEHYTSLSGTSMATPHVAGAAALLAQAHPDWGADELKSALVGAATPVDTTVFAQGAGRLDVARAFAQTVRTQPATVNFGTFPWPQTGSPEPRDVTFHNHGAEDVTLQLDVGARNLFGAEAEPGVLQLSAESVVVPAGGAATVTVTLDPSHGRAGAFAGRLVATSVDGETVVRTPLGFHKESETQRLTLRLKGSTGQPVGGSFEAVRIDTLAPSPDPFIDRIFSIHPSGGVAEVDLPVGVYDIAGEIIERGLTVDRTTAAVEHEVDLRDSDLELEFDARDGVPLRPKTDQPTHPFSMSMGSVWRLAERTAYLRTFSWGHAPGAELRGIPSRTEPGQPGRYAFEARFTLAPPMVSMRSTREPRGAVHPAYHVAPDYVARLDGEFRSTLVSVGEGDPEDFAGKDVEGEIGLVTLEPPATGNPYNYLFPQAERAIRNGADAGVAALVFWVDVPGAVLYQPYPAFGVSLPVLSLAYDEGRRLAGLVDDGPAELFVDADPSIESSYHLNYLYPEGVPSSPPSQARRADLARVQMELHGDQPSQRYALAFFAHDELPTGGMSTTGVWGPTEHTAYIGPVDHRLAWDRAVTLYTGDNQWTHRMDSHDLYPRAGRYPSESWFAGPLVPGSYDMAPEHHDRQFRIPCGFCREGDIFLPTGLYFDSEPSHFGYTQSHLHQVRMFAGDEELELQPLNQDLYYGIGYFELPPGPGTYRLEDRMTDPRGGGREVRTTWTFTSGDAPAPGSVPDGTLCVLSGVGPDASCRYEPLINLRYDLDARLDNSVRAGRVHRFELTARHHSQADGAPIAGVTVAASDDDGTTWEPARVRRTGDGTYVVMVRHRPWHRSGSHVSIKTTAWDGAGNRVEQEVIRAYRLARR